MQFKMALSLPSILPILVVFLVLSDQLPILSTGDHAPVHQTEFCNRPGYNWKYIGRRRLQNLVTGRIKGCISEKQDEWASRRRAGPYEQQARSFRAGPDADNVAVDAKQKKCHSQFEKYKAKHPVKKKVDDAYEWYCKHEYPFE